MILKLPSSVLTVHSDSQYLFAFEWTDPDTNETQQYTSTIIPQGSWDSPHLFGNVKLKQGQCYDMYVYVCICHMYMTYPYLQPVKGSFTKTL